MRKRPAKRSRPVSVHKKRSSGRSATTRGSRSTSTSSRKKTTPTKRSKRVTSRKKSTRSSTSNANNLQSLWYSILLWLALLFAGGWLSWYIVLWGVVPKLITSSESRTVAVVPSTPGGVVLVAQLESEIRDSTVFILDGEELVELPGEYGQYKLSAIHPLLILEGKDERYIRGSLNRSLGIFLDDEVTVATHLPSELNPLSEQVKGAFWHQALLKKNFSLDLIRVWYVLQYHNSHTVVRPESSAELAGEIREINGGTFATRDECRVAILNSTDISGLAGGLADIVENNGGIVIRLGQFPDELEESQLLYDPLVEECQPAIEQIKTLSPVPFDVQEDSLVQGKFRAPVVAIIGKNFD